VSYRHGMAPADRRRGEHKFFSNSLRKATQIE
jgi:hypothetical protein